MNARFDELRGHYGCGPVQFYGTDDALYERHLVVDNVVAPKIATPRQQFEAVARSVLESFRSAGSLRKRPTCHRASKEVMYQASVTTAIASTS
jgi:starch phosphorylase